MQHPSRPHRPKRQPNTPPDPPSPQDGNPQHKETIAPKERNLNPDIGLLDEKKLFFVFHFILPD